MDNDNKKKIVCVQKYDHDDKMFVIDESTLEGDSMSAAEIYQTLIHAYGIKYFYNCNFINTENERITLDDIFAHTHVNAIHRGHCRTCKLISPNGNARTQLEALIKRLQKYVMKHQKLDDVEFKLYNDVAVTDKSECKIYNILSKVWGALNIQDADDECPMINSYCKALGYMLTNDRSKRYFVCLYSKIKGWGKTAFTNILLRNTNGIYSQYGHKKSVNQFTMSSVPGNDFYQIDDITLSNQNEMCGNINNIVSNSASNSELKGRDELYITDIICRVILTTNIPFMPRDDTFGLCDSKMIEVTSNIRDELSLNESKTIADAIEAIKMLSQSEYDQFYNLCVKMYSDDESFITRHLRVNKSKDDVLDTSIADTIDYDTIKNAKAGCKLSDLLKYNLVHSSERFVSNDDRKSMRIAYSKICDTLDRKFNLKPCSLSSDKTSFYSRSYGIRDKRNFILNDAALNFMRERLVAFIGDTTTLSCEPKVYNGKLEDLIKC